jgi:UDP-glucose 4-epimerase
LNKVLVTGGAGFLGSHLVDSLIAQGIGTTALDNLFRGSEENIQEHKRSGGFRFVHGDVRNYEIVKAAMTDVDTVFHLAAINGTMHFYERPLEVLQVNSQGTWNVLQAALETEVERVIFASSSEVYGHPEHVPTPETEPSLFEPALSPRWSYAVSKLFDEHLFQAYHTKHGLRTVILRYFNVYGPRLLGTHYGQVVSIFIMNALDRKPLEIYGDGKQTRSFTYVSDAIEATLLAAQKDQAVGRVLNIGMDSETEIDDLADAILALCHTDGDAPRIHHRPARDGDPRRRCPDGSNAEKVLGSKPHVPLKEGLRLTVEWFKQKMNRR